MTDTQSSAHASTRDELPRAGVIHVRHQHIANFTVVGNHLAQHPDLSAVAIGLGVYIQSLPDGALIGIKDLTRRFREGEMVIGRALNELEDAGYLERRRLRTERGRVVTATRWYERPGAPPPDPGKRVDLVKRPPAAPASPSAPRPERPVAPQKPPPPLPLPLPPQPLPPADGPVDEPASGLLAGLRRRDPRLLLSAKDVRRLAPAVRAWLDRDVGPAQVARTLTADLPVGAITWPARLLAYRLAHWLPPALPVAGPAEPRASGAERPARPLPFQTCDGCERAFRATGPGRCRDCRDHVVGADEAA
ncbi:helix-turn-helix domain-containing protein [Streptomyces sp. NPDC037389]|uniref:helix-turn-helix domain-containing protein n=1 Tax=Streptomyces sp. NPDC037389 TaxID=3155369 RepID=UPI0033C6F59C